MSNPFVLLETNVGDILVELFQEAAPISVENFLQYVDDKHYDNTIFHRVVRRFRDPGWRLRLEIEQETNPCAHRQRSRQWPVQHKRHTGHGEGPGKGLRLRRVLQSMPKTTPASTTRTTRTKATVTRYSAGSPKAWMWSRKSTGKSLNHRTDSTTFRPTRQRL